MLDISKLTQAVTAEPTVKGSVVQLLDGLATAIDEHKNEANPDPVTLGLFNRLIMELRDNLTHLADAVAKGTSAEAETWAEPEPEPALPAAPEPEPEPELVEDEEAEEEEAEATEEEEAPRSKRGKRRR